MPMNDDDSELVVAHTSSRAEELARRARGARVVSAFHTVPTEVLVDVFDARKRARRPSLVYCGDDRKPKKVAATLILDVGFGSIGFGPLGRLRDPLRGPCHRWTSGVRDSPREQLAQRVLGSRREPRLDLVVGRGRRSR